MNRSSSDSLHRLNTSNADEAYAWTLSQLLDHGEEVIGGESLSVGSGQKVHELLNFTVVLDSPRDRLIFNKARRINLPAAVARFLWMMAGSDRLADIAFYEPKVSLFTDDGISIPGSSYGQRILRSRPGLNQLEAVIDRLQEDPQSRRAAISIYHPEDAIRASKDIPCAFGLFYHIRGDRLHSTTLMRSNNAFILLPYNIFEFSLLAEVVAAEVQVSMGALTHTAISMHLYERDVAKAREVIEGFRQDSSTRGSNIPEIPLGSAPLQQIRQLVILEAELRHESEGVTGTNIEEWIARGEEQLNNYWSQYYYLLLLYIVSQKSNSLRSNAMQRSVALDALESVITEPWKSYLPSAIFKAEATEVSNIEELVALELPASTGAKVIAFHDTRAHRQLQERAEDYERQSGVKIPWQSFVALEKRFAHRIAARDEETITTAEFEAALTELLTEGDE
jgi:thymidylate synthase